MLNSGGDGLSGGERQRLALARAFLRNPALVILDEASQGLDPHTRTQVEAALERLLRGRTVLSIVHDLRAARQAQRIIVLDQGRVAQEGTHAELVAREGVYRELARAEYTVADAYLFTIETWLEGDGVEIGNYPKIADHFSRMSERPAVRRALA